MKIAVCSFVIGDRYMDIVKYGIESRKEYCKKYNYDYIDDTSVYDSSMEVEWSKILIMQKYLGQYDFLVWIDADTFIMNDEITLESLIDRYLEGETPRDVMYTVGHGWINNGVFFVRNTEWVYEYFTEVNKNRNEICREQGSMDLLYRVNWNGCQSKVVVVQNQKEFNSFWDNYSWGDFIIHFPGCNVENRPENSLNRMMNMFCPIRMVEDSDDSYNFRINWLKTSAERDLYRVRGVGYLPLLIHAQPDIYLVDIMMLITQ
jgi:hypothetical protein